MKKILDFDQFFSRVNPSPSETKNKGELLEYGPDWEDSESTRFRELKDSEISFDLLGSDYENHALLKSKKDGKLYVLNFEARDKDSGISDYVEVPYEILGKDEDGFAEYEYDWQSSEVDDEAILAYASDLYKDPRNIGSGIEDYQGGEKDLILANDEIIGEIIGTVTDIIKMFARNPSRYQGQNQGGWKEFLRILSELFPDISSVNEAEGIHPAIRQHLVDLLKENPKATYAEAKNYISDKVKGWKLSEEDYEEAKNLKG